MFATSIFSRPKSPIDLATSNNLQRILQHPGSNYFSYRDQSITWTECGSYVIFGILMMTKSCIKIFESKLAYRYIQDLYTDI
jgi:hypothetical protein